ncbi:MAG: DUF2752 domain-containing protein [Phycisphaerales bacterium]
MSATARSSAPPGAPSAAPARLAPAQRALALFLALACLSLLALGARLTPSPSGHGTHHQLGLPACGWVQLINVPCPTCGMTTAVSHAAHGDLLNSARTQPFGFLFALAAAAAFWVALHAALTGARTHALFAFLLRPPSLCILAALWIGSWVYKIATWP